MPVDHSQNGFLKDIGTDWVALSPNGTPLARAATEDGVRRAVPDAADYITGKGDPNAKSTGEGTPHKAAPRPEPEVEPAPAAEPVDTDLKHLGPDGSEPAPAAEPEVEQPEPEAAPAPATTSAFDHDGDGRDGGSKPGEQSTVATGRRKRKPVA